VTDGSVDTVQDRISALDPAAVTLRGLLGARLDACRANRMVVHDEEYLLWPYDFGLPAVPAGSAALRYYEEIAPLKAPRGEHSWIYPRGMAPRPETTVSDWQGEFIGNWVAAASVMARNADDPQLREKLDRVVGRWLATQKPDGYLGTYASEDRWKSWDVWVQAHSMLGLLAYFEVSGQQRALDAARRVADRLLADFGPGGASLQTTGHHHGMASSSVLEPFTLLFRRTGERRYLEFAQWLVDEDWETPAGPKTVSALTSGAGVRGVGNRKALEMLITLVGLIELFRETAEQRYFEAVDAAWSDIVHEQLYITGSASVGEYFGEGILPNDGWQEIGETCVTMAWINLCLHLHRLTGDAKYFEPAERAIYNHLLAAQSEDGRGWAYYVGLRDYKRYREHTDPECCPSRGSRAMSMLPGAALSTSEDRLFINLFDPLSAKVSMGEAGLVRLEVSTEYPFDGVVTIELGLQRPATFSLCLRKPNWCRDLTLSVDGVRERVNADSRGYLCVTRQWGDRTTVQLKLDMEPRVVIDGSGNAGRVAFMRGPVVFAADVALLPDKRLLEDVAVQVGPGLEGVRCPRPDGRTSPRMEVRTARLPTGPNFAFDEGGRYRILTDAKGEPRDWIALVPFYEAGNRAPGCYRAGVWSNREAFRDATYQVWLPLLSA
jgi:DUF1680 family protein